MEKPHRNQTTNRKNIVWELRPKKRILIIGDSNVGLIPDFSRSDLQIECYPGMKYDHLKHLLKRTGKTNKVAHCILSVGINNRQQQTTETGRKTMRAAFLAAQEIFPAASIHIPIINYSENLPQREKLNLESLNQAIATQKHIPKLNDRDFKTSRDDIHWEKDTAQALLEHWMVSLN